MVKEHFKSSSHNNASISHQHSGHVQILDELTSSLKVSFENIYPFLGLVRFNVATLMFVMFSIL